MSHHLVPFSRFFPGARARTAATLLALACGLGAGTAQAQDVYLNGTVGGAIAPGVYGQITFGSRPPPPVLYAQPIWVQRGPIAQPPLYLYVPPGHYKNWRRHCSRYNACGRPVYFVQVDERNRWWAPRPDQDRRGGRGERGERDERGDGPGHGRGHDDHGRKNKHNDQGRDDHGPSDRSLSNKVGLQN